MKENVRYNWQAPQSSDWPTGRRKDGRHQRINPLALVNVVRGRMPGVCPDGLVGHQSESSQAMMYFDMAMEWYISQYLLLNGGRTAKSVRISLVVGEHMNWRDAGRELRTCCCF